MFQVRYKTKNMLSKLPTISPVPDPLRIEDEPPKSSKSSEAMKEYLNRVESYSKLMRYLIVLFSMQNFILVQ